MTLGRGWVQGPASREPPIALRGPNRLLDTLRSLVLAHAHEIPYESLDVMLGRVPKLSVADLQRKMIHGRRGGYCFEQNMLFRAGLRSLGYRVTSLQGRVVRGLAIDAPRPAIHMLLQVELDEGSYLSRHPLPALRRGVRGSELVHGDAPRRTVLEQHRCSSSVDRWQATHDVQCAGHRASPLRVRCRETGCAAWSAQLRSMARRQARCSAFIALAARTDDRLARPHRSPGPTPCAQ